MNYDANAFSYCGEFSKEQILYITKESVPNIERCISLLDALKKAIEENNVEKISFLSSTYAEELKDIYGTLKVVEAYSMQM